MSLTARLLFLLSFLGFLAQGQNPLELVPGTRVDVLLELADSFKVRATRERAEAEAFAREHGLPIRMEDSLQTIEIRRIENGLPLYNTVDNLTAAYTLNTDDLWNGGVLGLNIEGQNMVVGEWDGGAVLTNHQEFMPPTGSSRAIQQDGATPVNYHATHVAGTLIAEGQVNAARGMANQATLHAYDWNGDNSEMATAAANGLLVSNHSYGSVSGWRLNSSLSRYEWWGISTDTEDYRFGQYSYDAAAWDGIAYNAPYYLIVKSAGNDRGDSGADPYYVYSGGSWVLSTQPSSFREIDGGTDGFDCVTTNGNAKNILTVGAVDDISTGWSQASDVSMSSFSGWGPTDDGRIKPDVVGNGIGLYSTNSTNTSSYTTLNGTSMAAPNVAGSLILLQQLHLDSIGSYMRSATLKGLVIHTTNEAGSNPGPDYSHGWGLVDMKGAAQIILDQTSNDIVESTLNNGGTYTYSVVSDGITPISATLCWTDPAGTSQSAVLNETTSRLVNDLDVVITNGSATWQPWVLDPANPASAATTGNNARDNVEKIEAGVLPAGSYTIVVSHKGTLTGGSQNFSMIISGLSGVPSADFTVSQSSLCPGDTITLTSTSTGGATQFAWSISPATGWSFVNGTNANSQNPQVEFTATSGFYAVTLVASNSFGSGSITTDSVIKVGGYLLPYTNNLETTALRDEIEIINNDGNTAWVYTTNAVNGTSLSFDNFTTDNTGSFDWAVLPPLDLSNMSSAQLEFDYAYSAYSSSYSDTLIVAVSTSCGTTYTPVFYQGGVALQTTSAFTQSTFDPSTSADWCDGGTTACPTVDLAPYVGQSGVRIGFINKSGYGNNMYVDNIQVTGTASATPMSISGSQITHVACNGDLSGGVQITVTGGTSPYSYAWSNGATSAAISGIGAGTYGVTITDQLAQQVTGSYQVTEPSALSASASGNDESVSGLADGSATVSVSGGSSPYSYAWSNGGTTAFISNLSPATYTVTATDNNSCTVTASVVIGAGVDSLKISSASVQDLDCYQDGSGSVAVSITGGSAPYNYSWSNGATTSSISGLAAGSYQLTVTDGSGQQATGNYSVSEPAALTVAVNGVDESINGYLDGSASSSATGGTAPYSYSWSNGATNSSIANLGPGSYTITITDANNCVTTGSTTIAAGVDTLKITSVTLSNLTCNSDASGSIIPQITGGATPYAFSWSNGATSSSLIGLDAGTYGLSVSDGSGQSVSGSYTLTEPTAVNVSTSTTNESVTGAQDGSASVSASGGTSPYTYSWSNGATTASISGLAPGNYLYTVTDANLCTSSGSVTVQQGVAVLSISGATVQDLLCYQDGSGGVAVTVTGGTAPYSYVWSNGATGSSLSGLNAGSYALTVADQSGQQAFGLFNVIEPLALNITPSATDESIAGSQDGSASVSASGGTSPYTYSWSNGATTASISGLAPGNYLYTVTDANLCTSSGSVTVQPGVAVLSISGATVQDLLCYQDGSGGVAVTITGGTAPFNYIWSNGATASSISGLAAGSYQVTVSDGSGQQATGSYTVSEPSALSGLLAVNNQTVVGQNDGSIAALIQGGTPYVVGSAYQYNWSNGGTSAQITNLSPGTYTLTVTDSLGCTLTLVDSVETGADLMNIVGLVHTVSCAGGSDGSVDAQIIGGQAPYTYLWSNGATTQDISGLTAGFYTLSASDAVGQSDVQNFLVAEPLPITLAVSSQDESVQGYADGTAIASITGGTPPFTYIWSNGATTAQITNLSPGTYAITITDANNCSAIDSATIAAGVPVLQWSIQVSDVTCNDGSDGSTAIATTGGAAPIVFAWSNGSSTSTLSNLTAGAYAVTVADALGQSLDSVLVVQQPSALSIALVTADESIQGLADGSVSAGVSGGSTGYAYAWSNGATTAQIANLSPGTYTLTVTDAVGCTATNSATINPGVPVLTANALVNHVSCNGLMDGSIALQVSGGTAPIVMTWSNGDTSATISNLGPGTYNYTVTDGIGQVATGSGTIVEPTALTASTVVTDESIQGLQDGSVSVLVAGGTAPYQYLWSNGLTMSTLNNLGPGYYTCTITDQNGCNTTVGDTVFDGIPVLQDLTTYLHPACYGDSSGSISVAASGGVPPYAWNWSTGDTATSLQGLAAGLYYLTLSDQSGQSVVDSVQLVYPFALSITGNAYAESIANYADGAAAVQGGGGVPPYSWLWSTGATVDSISGLAAGTYTVTITDHNNCTAIDTLIVAPGVDTLSISISASNPDCFGGANGSIDLTTNGGLSPFIYQWSQGSIIQDPFGLVANTYFVTVTDALGQVATGSITLVDPPLLQVQLSTMDESVAGYQDGSASALVQGGTLPYTYLWSTGATSDSISGLAAGVYTLTVTDSLGCSAVVSDTVSTGVPVLQTSVQGQNILCFGGMNGVASIAVVGGASPYSFQWSNGSTSATITGVSAGAYLYTVTDAVGQTDAGSITLNEPTALSVPASITHETVTGQNDGAITLNPAGGTPPYSVLWSTGSSANPLQNLAPGDYLYTITDANGCSATDTLTILSGAALLVVTDTITHESCANSGNGSIALTVTGGIPPYNYIWSNGATGSAVLNLSAGNYGVTVTDGSGQTWTNSYAVTAPAALVLTGSTVNPSGFGLADGSISISIAGGSPGYVFSWSDGSSLSSRVGLMAGTYGLTLTDNQGCSTTGSWTLTDPAPPALSHSLSMVDVSCFDGSDGWVTVSAVGGVGPYSIVWADGSTLFSLSGLTAGSYAFTVSDGAGQQSAGSAVISQPSELMVQAFESSPGNLYAVVSGGTYPYTYSWSTSPVLTDSVISVPVGAEYEVVVTDANGCMADAFVTSTLSLETWCLKVQVYPNPGRDALWLSSDGQMDQVRVMDARGRTVYWLMDGASESLEINTSTWAMGTYYIQIESRGYTRVVKWVLNR